MTTFDPVAAAKDCGIYPMSTFALRLSPGEMELDAQGLFDATLRQSPMPHEDDVMRVFGVRATDRGELHWKAAAGSGIVLCHESTPTWCGSAALEPILVDLLRGPKIVLYPRSKLYLEWRCPVPCVLECNVWSAGLPRREVW